MVRNGTPFGCWGSHHGNEHRLIFLFLVLNTGLFIPVALAGTVVTFKKFGFRFMPVYAFLIIPNIAIWHFWPGNNAKYVIFFLLLASPLVGEVQVVYLFAQSQQKF